MKKILFILLMSFLAVACTKSDDDIVNPIPTPDPEPIVYRAEISVNFDVPNNVHMIENISMYIVNPEKFPIYDCFKMQMPSYTMVLTGDAVRDNLGKVVYLRGNFIKKIGSTPYGYEVEWGFILENQVELNFVVSSEEVNEVHTYDP